MASMIRTKNQRGPILGTWGTPQEGGRKEDLAPCGRTAWLRPERKYASHDTVHARSPIAAALLTTMLWSTNALLRSMNTAAVDV